MDKEEWRPDPLIRLIRDHENVSEHVENLEKMLDSFYDAQAWEELNPSEAFFRQNVIAHFAFEEKTIFPALQRVQDMEPLRVMLEMRAKFVQDGQLLPDPFLDITDRVGSKGNEQGLLGLAFHPQYSQNGRFFVNYTDKKGDTVIARFQVSNDASRVDPDSEVKLLGVDQPFPNHNGGVLAFGPDGYLYAGLGDGGSAGDPQGNAQKTDRLLGKILRLDVSSGDTYSIPADNPFGSEVWAYGLRNPWRMSFDKATGDLYIGDVGQNAWEEITPMSDQLYSSAGPAQFVLETKAGFADRWHTAGVVHTVETPVNGQRP